MPGNLTDDKSEVNIGSGNGLLPDGTKPVPEPMLTQIYVHAMADWNEILDRYT